MPIHRRCKGMLEHTCGTCYPGVIFTDGSGDMASWMWLDPLRDWKAKYSLGSAGLAYLYLQVKLNGMNFVCMYFTIEYRNRGRP